MASSSITQIVHVPSENGDWLNAQEFDLKQRAM